jgi:hypothetical protein
VNEPDLIGVRGEVGPRRLEGVDVTIDAHDLGPRRSVQDPTGVPASSDRRVDDDPAASNRGSEELRDLVGEDGFVI